ncbi:hypothetical protein D3C77_578640 [compost metagenome]
MQAAVQFAEAKGLVLAQAVLQQLLAVIIARQTGGFAWLQQTVVPLGRERQAGMGGVQQIELAELAIAQLRRGFHQPTEQAVGVRRARQSGESAQQGLGIAQRLWHLIEHCGHLRRTHRPARRRHPAWHVPAAAIRRWPWH